MKIVGPQRFDRFRQRVRRHRHMEVLTATAALAAQMTAAEHGRSTPLNLPNPVQPFALAAISRAALLYGNEFRDQPVTVNDLVEMCFLYAHIEDPALAEDPTSAPLREVLHRIAYEQFGLQYSLSEDIGRTLLLFEDHTDVHDDAPSAADWERLLGVPLAQFMRIGFTMHVAGLANGGQITREVLHMDHVTPIFSPLDVDDALAIVDRWYAATVDDLKARGLQDEVAGREKWSYNPLVAHPVIRDGNRYVMPCPKWVIDRYTPTGLYFTGLEGFGSEFPKALGYMYEAYVGTQLRQLEAAAVHPEIVYGRNNAKTVDWFVVTDKVIVLVEAKSARPIYSTRLGDPASDADIERKIGKAISQINNSARMLADGHPAVAHLNPDGLPVVGIVTTLEPFHLVNTFVHADLIEKAEIPMLVASAQELEGFIAAVHDRPDLGDRFLTSFKPPDLGPPSLHSVIGDNDSAKNPLLEDGWNRFSSAGGGPGGW